MNIGEKIRILRKQRGISPEKLGQMIDLSGQYIRKLESGARKSVTLTTARKLADGLGVEVSDLIDKPGLPSLPVRSPEIALEDIELSIKAYIPVYGEVSAGTGVEPIDYVASTRQQPAPDSYRAYRVKGLCLTPEIWDGDTIIVDTALQPQNNDLVVVIIDGEASVKKYREKQSDRISEKGAPEKWLENNDDKIRPEDVHLVGVVVEYNRKRRR
jgi:transcriptional regulator with XRE-family HTH domain